MCTERRATFQKTNMEDNGTVSPCYSLNLSRTQIIVSILVGLSTIVGSFHLAAGWARNSILDAVEQNFHTAADLYYESVLPERNRYYEELLDSELMKFQIDNSKPVETRLADLSERVTALETQSGNVVKTLDRHETLLLEILREVREVP